MLSDVRGVLDLYRDEPVRFGASPWVRMHALVQYPIEAIEAAGDSGQFAAQRKSLISEVISSPIIGSGILTMRDNQPFPRSGGSLFGRQHHPDQVLNYLSLAGVDLAEPLTVEGRQFTVRDLLVASMRDTRRDRELSWTVSAYAHYLEPGQQWTNRFDEPMSLAKLVRSLLDSKEDACGGSHRLTALARVVSHPELGRDKQTSGVWAEALAVLRSEVATLRANQLQTGFFALPPTLRLRDDVSLDERNIIFTGHTLEWFSLLPEPELARADWVIHAVEAITGHLPKLHDRYCVAVNPPTAWQTLDPSLQFVAGSVSHAIGGLRRWRLRAME